VSQRNLTRYSAARPWLRPNLLDGACIGTCPEGMYRNGGGACTSCHASCATCDGAGSGTCITCANSSHTLKGGRCAAVCPRGTAANGTNFCLPCHDSCATCRAPPSVALGANVSTCTSCVAAGNKPYLSGDACTAFCPNLTWANIAAGTCDACPASCRTCAAPARYLFALCTACQPGEQLVLGVCSPRSNSSVTSGAARVALLSVADGVEPQPQPQPQPQPRPRPETRNPKPETRNPKPETQP